MAICVLYKLWRVQHPKRITPPQFLIHLVLFFFLLSPSVIHMKEKRKMPSPSEESKFYENNLLMNSIKRTTTKAVKKKQAILWYLYEGECKWFEYLFSFAASLHTA